MTAPQVVAGWPIDYWLACADRARRDDIVIVWDRLPDQTAILPCGIEWDVVKTPVGDGLTALQRLLAGPDRRDLGPVLRDHRAPGGIYWLVPVETDPGLPPAGSHRLSRGHHIAAPAPDRGITRPAEWIHLPETAGILTPTHLLAAALQAVADERSHP